MIKLRHIVRTFAAIAVAGALAAPVSAQQVTFMTGPQGGSWIPLGGALKGMWENEIKGLTIQQTPGAGITNVRGVNAGKAGIGIGNSITTVDGVLGRPPYPGKMTKVCQLANLYPQYFQVVVRADSGINTFADVKGKSFAVQPKGNTAEMVTRHMLQVYGMDYKSLGKTNFVASYNDAVSMIKDGHADGFTLGTTAPASAVMNLASARDIKLIGVTDKVVADMKKINPGYNKIAIKAGTYPKQDKDVEVIGYSTHIIVACDLPEATVYQMAKSMAAHIDDLSAVVKSIKGVTPKDMAQDIGVPFHKGAAKYYKEVGAM
ncbi:MAG: TAXI family TRAP transporter solute-binding subunit [Betaproteobacteria bacterium]|jgi:hypothetical protein|nr:TAXI family TRAP transporter solute-binding subunit [Betaproteobacteria bacterium]